MTADRRHLTTPVPAWLGMGGNVGDALETLASAVYALHDSDGIAVRDVSGVYRTVPVGGIDQPDFLNMVVVVATTLTPHDLLAELQLTEAAFGRDRDAEVRWGPRTLDIDILLYDQATIADADLVVPHPRLHERGFVLVPLMEVMPGGELPDGTRLASLVAALAPLEGVELDVRLADVPGAAAPRPEGPRGLGAFLAEDWVRPSGPPPDIEPDIEPDIDQDVDQDIEPDVDQEIGR